ncbi:MAG: nucleoside hydrolase [Pseudomonadota bacterium]
MTVKMIIDTDPGVDDAMAILYAAAAPDIELVGLTTVFGNVTTPMATRNALRLVEMAGLDIPVAEGAMAPQALPPFEPADWVHGKEGFGNVPAAEPQGSAIAESAAEFLVRMARQYKGELVVCPIGPMTNIAAAAALDPQFTSNCAQIVTMGGSARAGGNMNDYAEANTFHDPHAAADAWAAGGDQIMVGLDVTLQILCDRDDFASIEAKSPQLGGFLRQAADFYIDFYQREAGLAGCGLHDPAAVIACTHPHLFTMEAVPLEVVTDGGQIGRTIMRPGSAGSAVRVCVDVQSDAVKALWLSTVQKADKILLNGA